MSVLFPVAPDIQLDLREAELNRRESDLVRREQEFAERERDLHLQIEAFHRRFRRTELLLTQSRAERENMRGLLRTA